VEPIRIERRAHLPEFLNRHGLTGTGVEVGVFAGKFSELILKTWEGKKLYSVDPWSQVQVTPWFWKRFTKVDLHPKRTLQRRKDKFVKDTIAAMDAIGQTFGDFLFEHTTQRLAPFGDRNEIIRETSVVAAKEFENQSLDFVYIDAIHSFEECYQDLVAWIPKVKRGGLVAGHDYNLNPMSGVKRALRKVRKKGEWTYYITPEPARSWFMWKDEQDV